LKKWKEEAKDLTEIDTYGQTKNGKDLYYIRINNKFSNAKKPVILMTAAIHGNEPLSTSITMAYIGFLLDSYGKSKEITDLMNTRDLYFIPVISPESYPDSRTVGEVDPNRDFPTPKNSEHQSIPIIMALREFYWKIKPSAVISGHTYGRIFMTPYGDNHANTPHEADYNRIVGRMSEIANYKKIHCVDLYTKPIDGSEVDWFYRNGSIAVCAEYGTHQNIPTLDEIKSEFFRVKDAITYFITESPNVVVKVTDEGIDFSKNTGISRKYSRLPNGDLIPAGPYQNPD
jgi:murein tripeptide amidase MpaA